MEKPSPNGSARRCSAIGRAVLVRGVWFAALAMGVGAVLCYAAVSSFPRPSGSAPLEGMARFHELLGLVTLRAAESPASWLGDSGGAGTRGGLAWAFWAVVLYGLSALLKRPRWVFGR
jgi:hypothetical protein